VVLAIVIGASVSGTRAQATPAPRTDVRLVYLVAPGPGGGGGGGGNRSPLPPRNAERRGRARTSSAVPPTLAPPATAPRPAAAPPPAAVEAPVVSAPADEIESPGVVEPEADQGADSLGAGGDAGAGAGSGGGVGDGTDNGIGEGDGGGTGGGPYRPGSGVEPPALLREVKPAYTEAARAAGIQGDVLIEVVVRRDGTVGDVRIIRGLGYGLDDRALEAVREWRFSAARRMGVPVDVLVEVAMEFRLR
jgi:TonB family protein